MEYRTLGITGLTVSRFGLGCMRLPKQDDQAIELIRYAVDHGVNYIDTAFMYSNSEDVLGNALKDGYRERTYLVSKSPSWFIECHADFEKYLDQSLKRLQTDHLDIYLLHNLYEENWEKIIKYDGFSFLDKMLDKGKILHTGFSAHSTYEAFVEIVDSYPWEMGQIQLNILDEHQQVGIKGLEYGAEKGLAMVIMEPLRGGNLVNNIPPEAKSLIENYPEKRSIAEWCFRWLYDKPEVDVILSGTSTIEQLKENIKIFNNSLPKVLSKQDKTLINQIRDYYEANKAIGCTGCKYCMPCPQGVEIPQVFSLYNNYLRENRSMSERMFYHESFAPCGKGGNQCISCGDCLKMCPQALDIPELLKMADKELNAEIVHFAEPLN